MVEEKMYYARIEDHGDISKTKRKEDNLNNTGINAVLFNYHHFTIQRYLNNTNAMKISLQTLAKTCGLR